MRKLFLIILLFSLTGIALADDMPPPPAPIGPNTELPVKMINIGGTWLRQVPENPGLLEFSIDKIVWIPWQAGVNGKSVLNGEGAPNNELGVDGDFYIDTASTTVYGPKAGDAWPAGVSMVGPPGEDSVVPGPPGTPGATWHVGTGAPADGTGNDGDLYLDQAGAWYGPKASGTWSGTGPNSIIGPPGDPGAPGTPGEDGEDGAPGVGFSDAEDDNSTRVEVPLTVSATPSDANLQSGYWSILAGSDGTCYWWNGTTLQTCADAFGGVGSGLPTGCTDDDILVADAEEETGWKCIAMTEHPAYIALMAAAGLNSFSFSIEDFGATGVTYTDGKYYTQSPFPIAISVTDTSDLYAVDAVLYQIDDAGYGANTMTLNGGSGEWEITGIGDSEEDGNYTIQFQASDDKGTPNTGESAVFDYVIDNTDPILVAGADDTFTSTDEDIECTVAQTETNPQAPTYTITGDISATGTGQDDGSGNWSTPILDVSELGEDDNFTCTWASVDLAGNEATGTDLVQVFSYEAAAACESCTTSNDSAQVAEPGGNDSYTCSDQYWRAVQVVVPAGGICLTEFLAEAFDSGDTGDLIISLRSTLTGSDITGTTVTLSSASVPNTDISAQTAFTLSSAVEIAAGTYYLVMRGSSGYVFYPSYNTADATAGNTLYTSSDYGATFDAGNAAISINNTLMGCAQ